jgi:hypothetical protein
MVDPFWPPQNHRNPGRPVIGRIRPPAELAKRIDWSKVRARLGLQEFTSFEAPSFHFRDDETWRVYSEFLRSHEGRLYGLREVPVAADGTFRIESVPAGRFRLHVDAPADLVFVSIAWILLQVLRNRAQLLFRQWGLVRRHDGLFEITRHVFRYGACHPGN